MTVLGRSKGSTANNDPSPVTSMQRYVLVGAIATGVDWGLFSVFLTTFELHYLLAGIISFFFATLAGYWAGLRLVFNRGQFQRLVEVSLVFLTSALGFVVHASVLIIFIEFLELHWFLSKVAATAATFFWNFAIRYYWIFAKDQANG